jgi:ATP-dependent DNA helicase HFM1/MER3
MAAAHGGGDTGAGDGLVRLDGVLPPHLRHVLPYETLNRVQSAVYDAVMHSNASIALAAPTGCGKTAVFEMAILKLLMEAESGAGSSLTTSRGSGSGGGGAGSGARGKVVYLSPLRALCAEKQADWASKFKQLGVRVALCTGDGDDGAGVGNADGAGGGSGMSDDARSADVVVATPEKWDAMTRRWRDNVGLIGRISLVCIDEVHTLAEDRGAVLEAVVSRMRTVAASPLVTAKGWPAARMRFVAVSATLPNLRDVAAWIGAGPHTTFSYDDSYRPVPLRVHVLGYESE